MNTPPKLILACSLFALVSQDGLPQKPAAPARPAPALAPAAAPAPPLPAAPVEPEVEPAPVPVAPPPKGAPKAIVRSKRFEVTTDNNGTTIKEQGGGGGGGGGGRGMAGGNLDKMVQYIDLEGLPRTTRTGRTLIVQSTDPDPAALANAEEDLSVMALILRKATGNSRVEERRVAMGIEVDSSVFGSSSGARNIYIEGYGALFLLGVRYPLIAPNDKTETSEAKEKSDDDWAGAREEYLSSGLGNNRLQLTVDQVWAAGNRQPAEEYDATKVEELKTSLVQALKNATHIRALKPDEFVTVVVQGADAAHPVKTGKGQSPGKGPRAAAATHRGETVMTVRASRRDIDAFAKGKLDADGFRKKTVMQSYFRRGDTAVGTAGFLSPGQ